MSEFVRVNQTKERIEDVYATRSFVVKTFEGRRRGLGSITKCDEIKPGINTAECHYRSEGHAIPPDPECTCGFYCYDVAKGRLWYGANGDHVVDAIVRVSGRVVVHPKGLRVQYMEVVAFARRKRTAVAEDELKAMFPNVPVFSSLSDALSEFPVTPIEREPESPRQMIKRISKTNILAGLFTALIAFAYMLVPICAVWLLSNHESALQSRLPLIIAIAFLFMSSYFSVFKSATLKFLGCLSYVLFIVGIIGLALSVVLEVFHVSDYIVQNIGGLVTVLILGFFRIGTVLLPPVMVMQTLFSRFTFERRAT